MRITEGRLRRIIRRAIVERMGYAGGDPIVLDVLRDAYGDPSLSPEDVRHLTYAVLDGGDAVEIRDSVIHAMSPPVVLDSVQAYDMGITMDDFLSALASMGARMSRR